MFSLATSKSFSLDEIKGNYSLSLGPTSDMDFSYINGEKIDRSSLKYGVQIQILNYQIEFLEGWATNQVTEDVVEPEEHLFIITTDQKMHSY